MGGWSTDGVTDKVQFLILSGGYKGVCLIIIPNLYICFVQFSVPVFYFIIKKLKTKMETKISWKQRLSRQQVRLVWTGVVVENLVRSGPIPDTFSRIGGCRRDRV